MDGKRCVITSQRRGQNEKRQEWIQHLLECKWANTETAKSYTKTVHEVPLDKRNLSAQATMQPLSCPPRQSQVEGGQLGTANKYKCNVTDVGEFVRV